MDFKERETGAAKYEAQPYELVECSRNMKLDVLHSNFASLNSGYKVQSIPGVHWFGAVKKVGRYDVE